MKKTMCLMLTLSLSFSVAALDRGDMEFAVELSQDEVKAGQVFKYSVEVELSTDKLPSVEQPEFKDFKVVSRKISQNISYKGQKSLAVVRLDYALIALNEGKFGLPPVIIKQDDKAFASPIKKIKVSGRLPSFKKRKHIPKESLQGAREI